MTGRLNSAQPYALGVFRIVIGLLFATHGTASLFGYPDGGMGPTPAVGVWPDWYAAAIELVCGVLVLVGLGTRAAAFLASGAMAYAYFKVHQPNALWPLQNGGDPSALYCWAMLLLVFTGSGAFGLDRLFGGRADAAAAEQAAGREKVAA
jgi:putative oxidoreductase